MNEEDAFADLYEQIYEDGFWIKEYSGNLAAVGDIRDMDVICEALGKSLEEVIDSMGMGEVVSLAAPGTGASRIEALTDAWREAKRARDKKEFPMTVAARKKLGLPIIDPHPIGTF